MQWTGSLLLLTDPETIANIDDVQVVGLAGHGTKRQKMKCGTARKHALTPRRQAECEKRKHKQKYNDDNNTNKYKKKMRQSEQHARAMYATTNTTTSSTTTNKNNDIVLTY